MGKNKKERKDGEETSQHSAATVCVSGLPHSFPNPESGNCSGSVASPQGYNEEDSSRVSTDYGTHLYEDGEEEEDELWREMAFAQESTKATVENSQDNDDLIEIEDCLHSFIYEDDTGEVCRVCGLIKTPIEGMIEVVFVD